MSGISNYTLNQKINAILGKTSGLPSVIDLDTTLTAGNNAGTNDIDMNNQDILNVNDIALTTINGAVYPPPAPSSVKPYISMSVGVVAPTYNNGTYYSLTSLVWGKAKYVSPTYGIGNTFIQQDIDNSFTGLYDATAGTITIPAGFGGFYSISWSASVQRASTSTSEFAVQLGSGTNFNEFAGASASVRSYITSGRYVSETAIYTEFSRFVMDGVVFLPAGQTIAVWNNSVSGVNMGGDYSPAYFRVAFLGF